MKEIEFLMPYDLRDMGSTEVELATRVIKVDIVK